MQKMDYTETEFLERYLEKVLTEKRLKHCYGVTEMACRLASIYGIDKDKIYFTALAHDIAKCFSVELMNRMIRIHGLDPIYTNDRALAHSKVGAAILKDDFGITDSEVLNAVSNHTTGRYGMSIFEEIIYVSDAIEKNRTYSGAAELRERSLSDLDGVCLEVIDFSIKSLNEKRKPVDRDTLMAKKYIEEKISKKENRRIK